MIAPGTLAAFLPAAVLVVLSPGPDTVYALKRGLSGGRAAGIAAGAGTATGILVHTAAAVVGLSALIRTSALAYSAVQYVGAAYLLTLGVQTIRNGGGFDLSGAESGSVWRSYRRAVVVNVSNPKVAVFVLAFFPQFVSATGDAPLQLSVLGVVYAGISLVYLAVVGVFAGRVRHRLFESPRVQSLLRYTTGTVLAGFGLALLFEEPP